MNTAACSSMRFIVSSQNSASCVSSISADHLTALTRSSGSLGSQMKGSGASQCLRIKATLARYLLCSKVPDKKYEGDTQRGRMQGVSKFTVAATETALARNRSAYLAKHHFAVVENRVVFALVLAALV